MILKVNKDICEIKQNEVWNVGDYNVHTVQVELSEDFDGLVNKVRYFVEDNSYDMLITDNVAEVPREATLTEGIIRIGVYGYDADTNILVQSTSPVNKYIASGTYTGEADNTEPLTPTDKQQMETAIQKNTDDIIDLQNNKQDVLISGENIKTINNESILGTGNIEIDVGSIDYNELENKPKINNVELTGNKTLNNLGIQPAGNYATMNDLTEESRAIFNEIETTYYNKNQTNNLLNNKQNTLVSGQNIKTINNESLLGEGNINIQSGGTSDYSDLTNKPKINNVELNGNKSLNDLGIQPAGNYALESDMTEAQNDIENLQTENERLNATLPTTTGEGENVTLEKTIELDFVKPPLPRGNSEQEGEPSPDNEVPITNVTGNVEVTISNENNTESKTLPVSLGNIELCKIGDYQDYLYKNNGKWYKHKVINKYICTGEENWAYSNYWSKTNTNVFYANIQNDINFPDWNSNTSICNYFITYSRNGMYSLDDNGFCFSGTAGNTGASFTVRINKAIATDLAAFKSWLSTHNIILYYELVTPTDTEITDATLISQLEEISKALSYQGQTNITSNTIAMFDVEAYQSTKLILEDISNELDTKVSNTDYAGSNKAGVIKTTTYYGTGITSAGALLSATKTYQQYQDTTTTPNMFISKGTLENVIEGKGLVSNTDYATSQKAGVIKCFNSNGLNVNNGTLIAATKTYAQYNSAGNWMFIGKGTLENVLADRIGDIDTILTRLTTGGGVS